MTLPNYIDWRDQSQSFRALSLVERKPHRSNRRNASRAFRNRESSMHGLKPIMGRNFTRGNQPGKDAVAIISHSLWQRRFDPNILNKTITINSIQRTVIGVMPEHFNFPKGGEVYAPIPITPEIRQSQLLRDRQTQTRRFARWRAG